MWHTSIRYQQGTQPDFKKASSTMALPQASRGRKETCHMVTQFLPLLLGNGMQAGGSPILSTRLKDGMTTDSTGQPVPWWFDIYLRKESQHAENSEFFIVNKTVTADGSLLSPTVGVNGIHPAPDIHEHFMIHKGYGTLRISSRTTSTTLSAL